ncbi:HPF/RaiA family ribosome-associated protein [Prauserella muralis]|uniref:Ribosomal subunit interface protein n=1 Tax=Prauserella muralis TaxID=588067 RepID=A0A2V4ATY7_9PSEU|nr:HPF/RaiA family ribosome-associated protein [Prauserella muralis]PXY19017.1 hypothetical protein BAY60_29815 [Prauserella muralis]
MERTTPDEIQVQVHLHGRLPGAGDYAAERVRAALHYAPEPVHAARVSLTRHEDPAVKRKVEVHATVDLRGRIVTAQADGENARQAVDLAHDRLRRRLEKAARDWEAIRGRQSQPGSWRHGDARQPLTPEG